jgi:hypothetical protein
MSADTDPVEEADVDEEPAEEDEEKPEIDNEEFADISAVAEEIEDSAGAGAEEEGDDEQTDNDAGDDGDADTPLDTESRGWGDMYVASVTSGLNAVIDEHGKPGAEEIDEAMARDLHLDEAFEEVMEKRGRADMPPEQEVLIGTLILAGTVVLSKTDLPAKALQEAGDA